MNKNVNGEYHNLISLWSCFQRLVSEFLDLICSYSFLWLRVSVPFLSLVRRCQIDTIDWMNFLELNKIHS